MDDQDKVTSKQQKYIEGIASGLDAKAAARKAGYSDSFSRVAAFRFKKIPAVVAAVAAIREEGMKAAVYDLTRAMQEAEEVIAFAKGTKNAMAYFKAVQHRAALSGLLIDRVELVQVDLKGAMEAAKLRVLNIIASPSQARLGPVADNTNTVIGGAHWNFQQSQELGLKREVAPMRTRGPYGHESEKRA